MKTITDSLAQVTYILEYRGGGVSSGYIATGFWGGQSSNQCRVPFYALTTNGSFESRLGCWKNRSHTFESKGKTIILQSFPHKLIFAALSMVHSLEMRFRSISSKDIAFTACFSGGLLIFTICSLVIVFALEFVVWFVPNIIAEAVAVSFMGMFLVCGEGTGHLEGAHYYWYAF